MPAALHTSGSCPVVFGNRGLGKTSLAVQGALIAEGDRELLGRYGRLDYVFAPDERFYTVPVTCTSATSNVDAVLGRITHTILTLLKSDPAEPELVRADYDICIVYSRPFCHW